MYVNQKGINLLDETIIQQSSTKRTDDTLTRDDKSEEKRLCAEPRRAADATCLV